MTEYGNFTTQGKVDIYESSHAIFAGLVHEMRELSKKKADATMSKGKVLIINRVLEDLKHVLGDEVEGKYLDLLSDEQLPQNSDAVLIMVQYESALRAFERRYHKRIAVLGEDRWLTEEIRAELEQIEEPYEKRNGRNNRTARFTPR